MLEEKLLVFVLGAPGAGKGTQCELIVKEFGWTHISAGDLLRAQVEAGTAVGKEAKAHLEAGTMVPASMIIGLLKDALSDHRHSKVLIDGFPRVLDQLSEFEAQVRPCDTALFYKVPEEVAHQRLLGRAQTSGRSDDNEETIRKRFAVFREESMSVIQALQAQGRAVEIDAAAPRGDVFAATRAVIERLEAKQAAKQAAKQQQPEGAAAAAKPEAANAEAAAMPAAGAAATAAAVTAASAVGSSSNGSPAAAATPTVAAAAAAAAATPTSPPAPTAAVKSPPASPAAAAAAAVPAVNSLQMDLSGIRTPIVICGPSGVGKGTLIAKLMAQYPRAFGFSVSHTTRAPRPGEQQGVHYYFSDATTMTAQVAGGMFLEHALVHGNMYGTSLAAVARVSAEGKHCVLDIDVQGAAQVRRSALGSHCCFIFVAPPSQEELERRLRNRGTETEEKVQQRLANAQAEISKAQEPGLFHHVLVNGDLDTAYAELVQIVTAKAPGLLTSPRNSGVGQRVANQRASSDAGDAGGRTVAPAASGADAPAPAAAAAPAVAGSTPAAPAAGAVAAAAATGTAVAAAGVAAALAQAPARQPPQQQQQQQPAAAMPSVVASPPQPLANGTSNASTAGLLDFGFGASSGHAVAAKGMPVRQYMDATVVPVLREGLKALNAARPDDPLQFLADYLVAHKAAAH